MANKTIIDLTAGSTPATTDIIEGVESPGGSPASVKWTIAQVALGIADSFVSPAQSGVLTGAFYPRTSNPSGYVLSSQTGAFYPNANPSNFVTPAQSGVLTGAFYPYSSNPSSYVITSQTGQFADSGHTHNSLYYPLSTNPSGYILPSQTGAFYPNANPSNFVTPAQSGALTGVFAARRSSINTQTGTTYTLTLTDDNLAIHFTNANAISVTFPNSGSVNFPIGSEGQLVQYNSGQVTVTTGAGVSILSADSALDLRTRYSTAGWRYVSNNTYLFFGDIST